MITITKTADSVQAINESGAVLAVLFNGAQAMIVDELADTFAMFGFSKPVTEQLSDAGITTETLRNAY